MSLWKVYIEQVIEFIEEENVVQVSIKTVTEEVEDDLEEKAFMRTLLEHFEQYIKVSKKFQMKHLQR